MAYLGEIEFGQGIISDTFCKSVDNDIYDLNTFKYASFDNPIDTFQSLELLTIPC